MDLGFSAEELKDAGANLPATFVEPTTENLAPPQETTTEATFQSSEVASMARESLDFLAGLAMPTIFRYFFPPVYLAVWQWLREYIHKTRDFSQLALGLPRGFAKSTVIKLFVLYCVLFTNRKFILITAENQTKANNILADVVDMLNEENIRKTFGAWNIGIETDRQDLKKFGYRGRAIILMAGTIETIRGINLKNERPDVMIFDDVQSREMAESQTVSDALERELYGTAMKAKSPHGCLFVFIANMYPTKWSILRKLKTNPNWIKFIAGGILADGTSLWEDLQPIEQLLKEFQNDLESGHPEIFYAEVLNDENASANNLIDLSKLPAYPFTDDQIPGGNFIIIDPATDKRNSDYVSVGYCEVFEGYPVLRSLVEGRLSPGDTISTALEFALTRNCRLIVVESNAYQYSLLYWFNFICLQRGIIGIECVDIYSGALAKNSRIMTALKSYAKGEFYVHPECKAPVHSQIVSWNPLKKENTDGLLDLLTYMPRVLDMYGEFVQSASILIQQEGNSIEVLPAEANCSF